MNLTSSLPTKAAGSDRPIGWRSTRIGRICSPTQQTITCGSRSTTNGRPSAPSAQPSRPAYWRCRCCRISCTSSTDWTTWRWRSTKASTRFASSPCTASSRSCAMSAEDASNAKVAAAQKFYRALAAGERDTLGTLLHPEFIGHATEGLPLDMGGEHIGPQNMQQNLWWRIGRHYKAEAQVDEFRMLDDGRLFVAGRYRGEGRTSGNRLDAAFIHLIGFSAGGPI